MKKTFFYLTILFVLFYTTNSCAVENSTTEYFKIAHKFQPQDNSQKESIFFNAIELSEEDSNDEINNLLKKKKYSQTVTYFSRSSCNRFFPNGIPKSSWSNNYFFQLPSSYFISLRVLRL